MAFISATARKALPLSAFPAIFRTAPKRLLLLCSIAPLWVAAGLLSLPMMFCKLDQCNLRIIISQASQNRFRGMVAAGGSEYIRPRQTTGLELKPR